MKRLTLDRASLDRGRLVICIGGEPVCDLDLNRYPEEVYPAAQEEYDILCDAVIDALMPLSRFTKGDWTYE